jgi:Fanconi anemia group M protein
MGITASPGSQSEKIAEICSNLGIEKIQTRTESDPDVALFVHEREIEWVKLTVPRELLAIRSSIEDLLQTRIDELNRLGDNALRISIKSSKKELLGLQASLMSSARVSANKSTFAAISILAEILKLYHAVELAETQGPDALARYFQRLEGEALSRSGSKASRRIIQDPRFRRIMVALADLKAEHPKPAAARRILLEQIEANPDSRIMVFTNYRDTATALLEFLKGDPEIRAVRFVGQASRDHDQGLSQKKQAEILQKFRAGEFNVLIATSVGEEGIDIPATDMVLFYEPVPSEIRSIQRKGRTGRARAGRVVVLMARGTRDEAYYWISDRKEKTMNRQIRDLSGDILPRSNGGRAHQIEEKSDGPEDAFSSRAGRKRGESIADWAKGQKEEAEQAEEGEDEGEGRDQKVQAVGLAAEATPPGPGAIFVDYRERDMAKLLERMGLEVTLRNLEVGDYVISERVAVERKTASDFVSSIIDPQRNLFRQMADLARTYDRPILILEGRDFYNTQMSPASIQGAMASVAVDYGVPIIPAEDQDDTARIIALLVSREKKEGREPKAHGHKTARTLKEQQEYLISAIPSVGPRVARNLLRHFGSVQRVVTASEEELRQVALVGPKIAERIRELVGGEYKG